MQPDDQMVEGVVLDRRRSEAAAHEAWARIAADHRKSGRSTTIDVVPRADDKVVAGVAGWFVDPGAAVCHRCHDRNYTREGLCLTCSEREHAGVGLPCGLCAGPCRIDGVDGWWDNQW